MANGVRPKAQSANQNARCPPSPFAKTMPSRKVRDGGRCEGTGKSGGGLRGTDTPVCAPTKASEHLNQSRLVGPRSPSVWNWTGRTEEHRQDCLCHKNQTTDPNPTGDLVLAEAARIRCGHHSVSERHRGCGRVQRQSGDSFRWTRGMRQRWRSQGCRARQRGRPQREWNFSGRFCVLLSEAER
jgi:hypothetical protein